MFHVNEDVTVFFSRQIKDDAVTTFITVTYRSLQWRWKTRNGRWWKYSIEGRGIINEIVRGWMP